MQPDAALTPDSRPELARTAALDQVQRMVPRVYVGPFLLAMVWLATSYAADHPLAYGTLWLVALVSGGVRIATAKHAAHLYDTNIQLHAALLYGVTILSAASNGLLYAHALHAYGFSSWTFTLVMLFTVGGVSGSATVFTPTPRLFRLYLAAMFGPALAASLLQGGKEGYTFVVITGVLIAFLLVQGAAMNVAYRNAMEAAARDAARTRELEVARETAEMARRNAEAANAAKSLFLANMSHEIRTPMHGILGMTDIASTAQDAGERNEALQVVRTSAEALLHVLNDILDFSKIEAGKMTFETVPFTLTGLVAEVRGVIEARIHAKGLASHWQVAPTVPRCVVGDPTRLKQVLLNLLSNALKFCETGSISLVIDGDADGRLRFAVTDTGIGIPKAQQATIFAAFSQADYSVTRKFGGTGLGLAISLELVRLMDGRMWLESEPGAGATFHFTAAFAVATGSLPAARVAPPAAPGATRPLAILLAEDNPVNQKLAHRYLSARGHQVSVASDGQEALRLACAGHFDLILMDNHMPEMGGLEATARIRNHELAAGGGRTPIVALTASAMRGDRERFIEAGMDAYLAKPFRAADLFAVIARLTEPAAAAEGMHHVAHAADE